MKVSAASLCLVAGLLAGLVTGATPAATPATPVLHSTAPSSPQLPAALDPLVRNLDRTVKPGEDFFHYANGGWIKQNPIPANERRWGIGDMVQEEIYSQLREICEAAAAGHAPEGSLEQKVGDFYAAGIDSARCDEIGVAPLQPELKRIAGLASPAEVISEVARLQCDGVGPLYGLYVGQDQRNSEKEMVHLVQGGIHLPDRDFYFPSDSIATQNLAAYLKHLEAMFRLLGDSPEAAPAEARTVLAFETRLAHASRTMEQLRDPHANYHKMSLDQLAALAPAIDWRRHLADLELAAADSVIVEQPEFFSQVDSSLKAVSLDEWRTYLRWSLVTAFASRLSRPFDRENFHFYETVLGGVQEQRPRWKRILDVEDRSIGDIVGQIWARKYCSPATKARYEKLVEDIFRAYRARIGGLPWMSAETKQRALGKLDQVRRKVGYPDRWRDMSTLSLSRDSYLENQLRIERWWYQFYAAKLGKPVDRTEWDMTPETYNAYYDETKVEIVLPAAAFMVPGVPDSLLDDALLYSYAGASTIGHELTHGFDDEGRQFDAHGNMSPWWTEADSARFTARTQKLVRQFDAYTVNGLHVRGQATLGENIADLGGIVLGYDAFRQTEEWKQGKELNGLTPDQRFFLGYALSWLGQERPETTRELMMSDVHSPQVFRVNGPLSDVPAFYQAFGIKQGDPLFQPDSLRVEIW